MLKKFLMLVVLVAMGAPIIGCNTMEGAGKDMERGGEKMQDTADRNR
jgi:entericidin B